MKLSTLWLRDYVTTTQPAVELGERFRMTSSEVDGITEWADRFKHVVVGKVLMVEPHPQADRLRIATVDIGTGSSQRIVCGAPDLREGIFVPVALPGAVLTSTKGEVRTMEETIIRGIPSPGMLCGGEDLGLPLAYDGLLVLENNPQPGTSFAQVVGLEDKVLDLEITPNRPDLLSYVGLAREVATFERKTLKEPSVASLEYHGEHSAIRATISDSKLCQRYTAICVEGNLTQPSPLWMQLRLIVSGMRPLNLIVDVTNYVMLELGQPLHAFALPSLVSDGHPTVHIRAAKEGEQLTTLDDKIHSLAVGDIIIADDAETPIDLAGIMGGISSAMTPGTTQAMLESAVFFGPSIRRTSRRLGVRTEASTRFEKGLDPEAALTSLKRAVYLLQELGGATISSPLLDLHPRTTTERPRLHVPFTWIQQILGIHISSSECKTILQKLGFHIYTLNKSSIEVSPPSWRQDVRLPEDVLEELVRIWGYERIPTTLPTGTISAPRPNARFERIKAIRHALATIGMHEVINIPFTSAASLKRVGLETTSAVPLQNPLSREGAYMSPSHLIGFLETISQHNRTEDEVALFEIGSLITPPLTETLTLSCVLRSSENADNLYREFKAACNRLTTLANLPTFTYKTCSGNQLPYLTEGSMLEMCLGEKVYGFVGIIAPHVVQQHKIRSGRTLLFASLDMEALVGIPATIRRITATSAFPSIERAITVTLPAGTPVAMLEEAIQKNIDATLTTRWYTGTIFPKDNGARAITFHLTYTHPERTLEDGEVNADMERLTKAAESALNR